MKRVGACTENISGSPAHNHAITVIGDLGKDLLYDFADAVRIDHFQSAGVQAALKTAAHERLEEPIESRVSFLLMFLDVAAFALHPPCDCIRQQLVPQLPTQSSCHSLCDYSAAAAVFAIDGDYSNCHIYLLAHSDFAARARRILSESEGQQEHDCGSHGQNPIRIDVCERCGLGDQCTIEPAVCLTCCSRSIQSRNSQTGSEGLRRRCE